MPFRDSSTGIDFNFEMQEGLIGNRGTYVIHSISVTCPCLQVSSEQGMVGHADPTCDRCFGQGYLYRDPVRMQGIITGLSNNRLWAQVGWIQPGDLSFSPSLKVRRISDFDKIMLTVSSPVEGQVIVRGQDSMILTRPSDLNSNEDLLYWESGRPEAIYIEDEDGVVYHPGQYHLYGRRIIWATNGGPSSGKRYSIKYEAYPEYITWVTPMDRWDVSRELGQRVMLRKASVNNDPSRKQIVPPWIELISQDGPQGIDDPFSKFGGNTRFIGEYVAPSR